MVNDGRIVLAELEMQNHLLLEALQTRSIQLEAMVNAYNLVANALMSSAEVLNSKAVQGKKTLKAKKMMLDATDEVMEIFRKYEEVQAIMIDWKDEDNV